MSVSLRSLRAVLLGLGVLTAAGCGGAGGDSGGGTGDGGCTGFCADTPTFLTVADVQRIIAQAVNEATALNAPATIAVVDRVGNVLAVFQMPGAATATVTSGRSPPVVGGLEGIGLPGTVFAIAKAVTGAYLSSEGNAFTTRTANQIIQEHFNPRETNQPSGPLFGVQFSQLPCSDLNTRFGPEAGTTGPKRSPVGFSADPGGVPLYKNGTPVGAIGVISDGIYGLDLDISDVDKDNDERIALAGTFGFTAPEDRRADRITVDGRLLRFIDAESGNLASNPDAAPAFETLPGSLVAVTGYTNGQIVNGVPFGQPESGYAPADLISPGLYPGLDAFVLVDINRNNRFPPRDGMLLSAQEVTVILQNALRVANRARAQIRRPTGSQARVTVSVVDTDGTILGIARTRDAPIFGTDVSLQKARAAALFSNPAAADTLALAPDTIYRNPDAMPSGVTIDIFDTYVVGLRNFLGRPTALADGAIAFSDRAIGNLARPFFPDGVTATLNGPFSKPFPFWSPFSVGLQLDLVLNQVVNHVFFVLGAVPNDVPTTCANTVLGTELDRIRNGIQIFPGSVPIYKGAVLAGAIGISGDGVDQDDMVGFLGLHNAGVQLGTVNNAPKGIRADTIDVPPSGISLRYVQCPQAPFIDSNEQNACEGK